MRSTLLIVTLATGLNAFAESDMGVWRYPGGSFEPIELRFYSSGKAEFVGGYEFFNPLTWEVNADNELILEFKMGEQEMKVMNSKIDFCLKNVSKTQLVYALDGCHEKFDFMGVYFFKEKKPNNQLQPTAKAAAE